MDRQRTFQKIMMAVIISAVAFGASYNILTGDQVTKVADAVLVTARVQQ